ncbi:DNA modification methylase [Gracilimonas mengyeensis]|uniref:Methyltransferase n=2 Tax=Gracilimonas mengyeensis TaxID=1302730 RepID=A0A521BEC8_9BACT|nr:DNA modification methylase [Gracilimonas mengyeensis]
MAEKVLTVKELDKAIPAIAKDKVKIEKLRQKVSQLETNHVLAKKDARDLSFLEDESIQLAITSPPYWNLKKYDDFDNQLGNIDHYQDFHTELNKVWSETLRVLEPGGRLIVIVGDVLLSRRKFGRHKVVPLHADIQVNCEKIGFDNLAPIFWHKISNASFEVNGNSKFLGKPYEPNGIIKHDIEYILMLRKPGGYRSPSKTQRKLSIISEENFNKWYTQIWNVTGTSSKFHPAPYPKKVTDRLVQMFSFVGDTVIDPFVGSGTTIMSCCDYGRNSMGFDINAGYLRKAYKRVRGHLDLLNNENINIELRIDE